MPHIVRNYTFEQHLHSSEKLNACFLEIKHTNVEIQKLVYFLPLAAENIGN